MKKKVLYGVFAAMFIGMSMGTLQSCKDDLEDFSTQVEYDLSQAVKDLQGQIDAIRTQAANCKTECQAKIDALRQELLQAINAGKYDDTEIRNKLSELSGEIKNLVTLNELTNKLNALETKLTTDLTALMDQKDNLVKQYADAQDATLKQALETQISELETRINTLISTEVAQITARINQLDSDYKAKFTDFQNQLNATNNNLDELQNKVIAIEAELDTKQKAIDAINTQLLKINETLSNVNTQIGEINTTIQGMIKDLNDLKTKYDNQLADLNSALEEAFGMIYQTQEFMTQWNNLLQSEIDELSSKVDGIADSIEALEDKYDSLTLRLNSLITGIIIQAAESPVFGNFSLPIGVQSNMLFNWYGENLGMDFNFPAVGSETTFDGEASALTDADLAFLGVSRDVIANGYLADEFNLGNVYMTVNPIGHNFDATSFSLETSAGKALPYEVRVTPSDKELYFGYSRGVDNGFYEGAVVMPATDAAISASRITIDEGLKTAVKDILKDRSKRNAYNLLRAVYDQLNGMLPAYALRYDKHYMDRSSYSILSKYELAVATAKPLSYKFFYDKTINHRLRKFGHLDNIFANLIDKDKFKFEINTSFHIDDMKITFDDLYFDFSNVDLSINKKQINVTIPSIEVYDNDGNQIGYTEEKIVPVEGLDDVYQAIEDGFKQAITELGENLNKQINDQIREKLISGIEKQVNSMLSDIETQITDMLKDLEDSINGQISDMIDDVMNTIESKTEPIFSRVNKVIDIYNKVADKINNFLADPNSYLQPVIFYKNNGGVGILSNVKNDPTILVKAGGDAFSLYLSSYSAEIVAPAFKKFVAVTNVYDADGNSVLAANSADVKAINAKSAMFNKVLPGNTIRAAVAASNMKAGLTYEIVYQGVDYSGVTSTQKFYIKVK